MMAYSEDHIALAAEYALGTLDADERAQVETMMSVDKDFAAMVQAWEYRLGVLNQMVGSVEPRPEVWDRIRTAAGLSEPQEPLVLPEAPLPPPVDVRTRCGCRGRGKLQRHPSGYPAPALAQNRDLHHGDRRRPGRHDRGRDISAGPASRRHSPQAAHTGGRGQDPPTPAPPSAQYVAVLQKDGGSPAFILTVDGATRNFTVRKVGAQPEPGRSYELWMVSDKLQRPRSLGVIGGNDFTARPVLAAYDPEVVNQATYAVTVEPEGGSPTGVATGPIVFTGKLIESVPPAAPAPARAR